MFTERSIPNKRPIFIIGGVHGDEPEGVELATQTLKWLLKQEEIGNPVPNSWLVIPCLNLEGFVLRQRQNANGVDLNRNYPSLCWEPNFDSDRYFPGEKPGSEPEVQMVMDLIKKKKPQLIIHCHSWKPCIVYTGEPGFRDAELLANSSAYKLVNDIGYSTPGSLSDFAWNDNGIPVICVEERAGIKLDKVWPHFGDGMQSILLDSRARVVGG